MCAGKSMCLLMPGNVQHAPMYLQYLVLYEFIQRGVAAFYCCQYEDIRSHLPSAHPMCMWARHHDKRDPKNYTTTYFVKIEPMHFIDRFYCIVTTVAFLFSGICHKVIELTESRTIVIGWPGDSLVPWLSINTGEEKRAWYQTYLYVLDIVEFISSKTVRMMRNYIFAEDDLLAKVLFEFVRDNSNTLQTTIVQSICL